MAETSIIIRTFNEERHLPALFDAIGRQGYRDFETVVVDSGSFDRSREIAQARGAKLVRIDSHDFTFGHSLNVGIEASSGRYLVIVSAHCLPIGERWLEHIIAPLRDGRTAMVYGRQEGAATSKFGERMDFDRTFGPNPRTIVPPNYFANNANSAIRKDLWEKHPFSESLPGLEDIEWAKHWMDREHRVAYQPAASVYHIHDENWAQVRRRYFREGQAAKWIGIRGRRHVPLEVLREAGSLVGDLAAAAATGALPSKLAEILRFRYTKTVGFCRGVWDGATSANPLLREKLLFDKPCKAVVISGPGSARLTEIELPPLKPGEALVRVAYQGVCGTDLEILDGTLGYFKNGLASYPIVPGHEFSGVIASTGPRVDAVKEGDRVVVECIQGCGECADCKAGNAIACPDRREVGVMRRNGGYAEYMITPARFIHRVPDGVPLRKACLAEPLAVVHKALRRLEAAWGDGNRSRRCAAIGAGTIGHLVARVLQARGHHVESFDLDKQRLGFLEGSGIPTHTALEGLDRFEAIVECTGRPDALDQALHRSRSGSTLLLVGFPYGSRPFNFESVVGYDKTIIGSVGSSKADFDAALKLLPKLDTDALLGHVFPWTRYEDAWAAAREHRCLKPVLEVDGSLDRSLPVVFPFPAGEGRVRV